MLLALAATLGVVALVRSGRLEKLLAGYKQTDDDRTPAATEKTFDRRPGQRPEPVAQDKADPKKQQEGPADGGSPPTPKAGSDVVAISADELVAAYQPDESGVRPADRYKGRILEVTGTVKVRAGPLQDNYTLVFEGPGDMELARFALAGGRVSCRGFLKDNRLRDLHEGTQVTVRGRCLGILTQDDFVKRAQAVIPPWTVLDPGNVGLIECVLVQTGAPPRARGKGRLPVPAQEAQAKAGQLIRDLFKADYENSEPHKRRELAAKLLGRGRETKDDAVARFVLYREGRDLAAQAGDTKAAFQAIEYMATHYAIDPLQMKLRVLETVNRVASTPQVYKDVVEAALDVVRVTVVDDDYELAFRLLKVAASAADKANSEALVTRVKWRDKSVHELQKAYDQVKPAKHVLQQNPNDPEANLATGRFLWLVKGDWDNGLRMLARGNDVALKSLAEAELNPPRDPGVQVKLGEAWEKLAESQQGLAKSRFKERAAYWYQQAIQRLRGVRQDEAVAKLATAGGEIRSLRFSKHEALVQSVSLSRDGRRALSGDADGIVLLWDTKSGAIVRRFDKDKGKPITWVSFLPDNRRAMVCSHEASTLVAGDVRWWDLETGKEVRQCPGSFVSSDGQLVLRAGYLDGRSPPLWDVEANKELCKLEANPGPCVVFSPDKRYVLGSGTTNNLGQHNGVLLFEAASGKMVRRLAGDCNVGALSFSPDGRYALTGDAKLFESEGWIRARGLLVRLWHVASGEEVERIRGSQSIAGIAVLPDGRRILFSDGTSLRLWDVECGKDLRRIDIHNAVPTCIAVSADGRLAIAGCTDKTVRLWELPE